MSFQVECKGGVKGQGWTIILRGDAGEKLVIRAETAEQAEEAARAVRLFPGCLRALNQAHSALYVHGDCDHCSKALESVDAVLNEVDAPLVVR